jgi:hypothetical protein
MPILTLSTYTTEWLPISVTAQLHCYNSPRKFHNSSSIVTPVHNTNTTFDPSNHSPDFLKRISKYMEYLFFIQDEYPRSYCRKISITDYNEYYENTLQQLNDVNNASSDMKSQSYNNRSPVLNVRYSDKQQSDKIYISTGDHLIHPPE